MDERVGAIESQSEISSRSAALPSKDVDDGVGMRVVSCELVMELEAEVDRET